MGTNLTDFWHPSDWPHKGYNEAPPKPEDIVLVEASLGYKLPGSYVELMRTKNGGVPKRPFFRLGSPGAADQDAAVVIQGLMGIGRHALHALCGRFGSRFWIESEWSYPPIGVYFADTPSGGHELFCLDYRQCGPTGEPTVAIVFHGDDITITQIAETFTEFIGALEPEDAFDFDE